MYQRVCLCANLLWSDLDDWKGYILQHRGVEHPFLNDFAITRTGKEDLKKIFLEFYYFIQHLPFYIAGMATTTKDERILREIAINLAEEVGERDKIPHLEIYRGFMTQLGITDKEVSRYTCLDSTENMDKGVEELYTKSPIEKALGAMYAL